MNDDTNLKANTAFSNNPTIYKDTENAQQDLSPICEEQPAFSKGGGVECEFGYNFCF